MNSEKKPVLATLVMKASGMGSQRFRTPMGVIEFSYKQGIGHIREYTDLATFHAEELIIRKAMLRMPVQITTVLGDASPTDRVAGGIAALIKDTTGHRPTKLETLKKLRAPLDAEIARLEAALAPKEKAQDEVAPQEPLTPRLRAIQERRNTLRQAGEHFTRGIAQEMALGVDLYHNHEGMIDAIIELEFPEGWQPLVNPEDPRDGAFVLAGTGTIIKTEVAATTQPEPDLFKMPMAELKEYAKARNIPGKTRAEILEAITAPAR